MSVMSAMTTVSKLNDRSLYSATIDQRQLNQRTTLTSASLL
jgi:hypothetical protein